MRIGLALVLIFPLATWGGHWSLKPVRRPVPPALGQAQRPANAVDSFVFAKLAKGGLAPSRLAGRPVLIRRLHLVMLGMHPSPGEVAAFVNDPQPDAWERLVDRVLDDPRLGERWAQHWLDVIRWAETVGFETNGERAAAWHYRDWVIHALNADLPYDQFISDQLAGDVTGADAALGFLVSGPANLPGQVGRDEEAMRSARQDELDEVIRTVSQSLFGLTIDSDRLCQIRSERRPNSRYSSRQQCEYELAQGQAVFRHQAIPFADTTQMSIEEIGTTILQKMQIRRELRG